MSVCGGPTEPFGNSAADAADPNRYSGGTILHYLSVNTLREHEYSAANFDRGRVDSSHEFYNSQSSHDSDDDAVSANCFTIFVIRSTDCRIDRNANVICDTSC